MSRREGVLLLLCLAVGVWGCVVGVEYGKALSDANERPTAGVFRIMGDGRRVLAEYAVPAAGGVEVRAQDLPRDLPKSLPPHNCGDGE